MPALFAPALDLAALSAVLVALALVYLAYELSKALAGALNFSVLGVHPLANVAKVVEGSIVKWLGEAADKLQDTARDLWAALTWMLNELMDGLDSFAAHTEAALKLLWGDSIPAYVTMRLRTFGNSIDNLGAGASIIARTVAREVQRLDAKIDSKVRALDQSLGHDLDAVEKRINAGIGHDIGLIKSSVDTAIDRALGLARTESANALGELRRAENAAIGALGAAQDATTRELHDLLRNLNPAEIASLAAAVPVLATLVNTIASESGLDNAACRSKVKDICGTDPTDWGGLLVGIGVFGVAFDLEDIVSAGREVVGVIADGLEDFAFGDE